MAGQRMDSSWRKGQGQSAPVDRCLSDGEAHEVAEEKTSLLQGREMDVLVKTLRGRLEELRADLAGDGQRSSVALLEDLSSYFNGKGSEGWHDGE